uniref:CSON008101 protein n=1 Tax=Culicoides sonorensis TaxID=179676 RepID=A0A336M229_CULSO
MNQDDEITKTVLVTHEVKAPDNNIEKAKESEKVCVASAGRRNLDDICDVNRYTISFLLELRAKCLTIRDELRFKLVDFKILTHSYPNNVECDVRRGAGISKHISHITPLLHLDMFIDEDLHRIVANYQEIRNVAQNGAQKWFSKESDWIKSKPSSSQKTEKKQKDYLKDLMKNNKPINGLISVTAIEEEMTRAAKAEYLKKQIRQNISIVNDKMDKLKNAFKNKQPPPIIANPAPSTSKEPSKSKNRTESQSSTSSKRKSKDKTAKSQKDRVQQPQLSINNSPITKEAYLILSLLSLQNPVEREQYLIKIAKERELLQRNPENNVISLNPKYGGIFPVIKKQAQQNIDQMAPCVLQINGDRKKVGNNNENAAGRSNERKNSSSNNGQVTDENKKPKFKPDTIKKELSYQEQVMQIVNEVEELPKDLFKLKHNFRMPKQPLNEEMYQEYIDKFVKTLVDQGAGHLHEGEIRINSKNYTQAFVCDKETRDVFIGTPCLRRFALQSDLVQIYVHHGIEVEVPVTTELLNDSSTLEETPIENGVENEPTVIKPKKLGFVTKILEKRNKRTCIGTFSDKFSKELKSARFVPRDVKMPIIHIPKQNWPNALLLEDPKDVENIVYLAEIIDWKGDRAIGNILKPLGKCGDLEVENEAILVQNNLDITPFSEEIIKQLPSSPYIIPEEEFAKRKDLRNMTIFTIDPLTARDLDDALSCRKLENGNYEIGVHISDVSFFLKEGSDLDNIVKEKATTIYMVDNVYHMLPKPLCFLCSLLPGEDKLAFSVFWEMNEDAKIVSTRFARTVINSCTQFAYEHAQKIMDMADDAPLDEKDFPQIFNNVKLNEIRDIIKILQKLAAKLRKARMDNGALKIDQPKLSFRLNPETGRPMSYGVYELKEANRMIEDWMLLANCTVAAFIFKFYPKHSIVRGHSHPSDNSMDNLEGMLKKFDLVLNGRGSKELRDSMEQIIMASESPAGARTVMNVLLSKPMQRAKYFCSGYATKPEDFYHFALAVKIYTHFTSPIRRYADVMVHRTLAAALKYTEPSTRTTEELQSLAGICNMQKWNAKNAGDECSELYFRTYLNEVGSIKARAAVIAMGTYSLEVVLMETGHTIKIFYKYLEPDTIIKPQLGETKITKVYIWWPKEENIKPRKITLFSELNVQVTTQKMKLAINKVFP